MAMVLRLIDPRGTSGGGGGSRRRPHRDHHPRRPQQVLVVLALLLTVMVDPGSSLALKRAKGPPPPPEEFWCYDCIGGAGTDCLRLDGPGLPKVNCLAHANPGDPEKKACYVKRVSGHVTRYCGHKYIAECRHQVFGSRCLKRGESEQAPDMRARVETCIQDIIRTSGASRHGHHYGGGGDGSEAADADKPGSEVQQAYHLNHHHRGRRGVEEELTIEYECQCTTELCNDLTLGGSGGGRLTPWGRSNIMVIISIIISVHGGSLGGDLKLMI